MIIKIKPLSEKNEPAVDQRALSPALPPNGEDVSTLLPPVETIVAGKLAQVETQKNAFEAQKVEEQCLDLVAVPPAARAMAAAAAKSAGIKIINEHLLDIKTVKKTPPTNSISLDFGDKEAKEAEVDKQIFRVSRRKDLDVLFEGLPTGPQIQDEIVKLLRTTVEKAKEDVELAHFIVYVYLALAIPNSEGAVDGDRWKTGPVSPKDFQRLLPKVVREHFKIETWFRRSGARCDAVWYKAVRVNNEEAAELAVTALMLEGLHSGVASETVIEVPKDSGYAKSILASYKVA